MVAVLPALGLALLVLVAGVVNGVAGFGFAVVATMGLAVAVDPATAVAFMIVPMVGVNLALVRELSPRQLRSCGRRFWPLILTALAGTVVGMVTLETIPVTPLRVGLGVVTLGFVVTVQRVVVLPGRERATEGCFVESPAGMAGVGTVSGVLFGGTNVGVQLVAFLRSCDLAHGLFVGVVALVFVGINTVRVGVAAGLGFYPNAALAAGSVAAVLPAVGGVALGQRLRQRIPGRTRRGAVLGLLSLIGIRLVLAGAGI